MLSEYSLRRLTPSSLDLILKWEFFWFEKIWKKLSEKEKEKREQKGGKCSETENDIHINLILTI